MCLVVNNLYKNNESLGKISNDYKQHKPKNKIEYVIKKVN